MNGNPFAISFNGESICFPFEVGRGCLTNIVGIPFTLIKGGFAFDEYLHTFVFTQFLGALLLRRLAKNEKKRAFLKFFS